MTNTSRQAPRRERILAATLTVLLGAVLLTSHAVSGAMAKYTTAAAGSDAARVALFGHSEKITPATTWPDDLVPGATTSFGLYVSNAKDGQVSEVAQSYEIEVVTAGNLPLHYELVRADGTSVGYFDESSNSATHTFSDSKMTFSPEEDGKGREDKYTIKVSWPSAQNGAKYSGIPDFLQVNINVKQVD